MPFHFLNCQLRLCQCFLIGFRQAVYISSNWNASCLRLCHIIIKFWIHTIQTIRKPDKCEIHIFLHKFPVNRFLPLRHINSTRDRTIYFFSASVVANTINFLPGSGCFSFCRTWKNPHPCHCFLWCKIVNPVVRQIPCICTDCCRSRNSCCSQYSCQ